MNTYTAKIKLHEDGWWVGSIVEVPAAMSQGRTRQELIDNLEDALELVLTHLHEAAVSDVAKNQYELLQLQP